VIGPDDQLPQTAQALQLPLPEPEGLEAARNGERRIVETATAGTPVRVLSIPFDRAEGRFVLQVVGDRSAEVRALNVLLVVLGVGGLAVMAASLAVGWVYAERALGPIRDAMRRQREFAADASHELRTPLAIVRGSVEHLRRHPNRPVAQVGDALDDMEAEVGRLNALVDDLLLLARTDSGEVEVAAEPLEMAEVALDAAAGLNRLAEERGVRVEVDAEPVVITGDTGRLRQLVTILGDNAVRHSPAGGLVRIGVHPSPYGATLTVEDDGPGFAPDDLPRVFDRFWRAAGAPAGGTGLGLAIAAWIVERHRGRIRAANRAEGGARLEVQLPR
jgi:signal transduction histidine kinase